MWPRHVWDFGRHHCLTASQALPPWVTTSIFTALSIPCRLTKNFPIAKTQKFFTNTNFHLKEMTEKRNILRSYIPASTFLLGISHLTICLDVRIPQACRQLNEIIIAIFLIENFQWIFRFLCQQKASGRAEQQETTLLIRTMVAWPSPTGLLSQFCAAQPSEAQTRMCIRCIWKGVSRGLRACCAARNVSLLWVTDHREVATPRSPCFMCWVRDRDECDSDQQGRIPLARVST